MSEPDEVPDRQPPSKLPAAIVAEILATSREHHGEALTDVLESALQRRLELDDRSCGRALRRTATLAGLRLDPATLIASAVALIGVGLDGARDSATGPADSRPTDLLSLMSELELNRRVEIRGLIDSVERLAAIHWNALDEESAESLRTMFVAMAADVRVVLVTLCDRLEVIRELHLLPDPEPRRRIASETREVFAPLANRLGIWQLKWVLEDLALRELEPEVYADITAKLDTHRDERQRHVDEVVEGLRFELDQVGLVAEVNGRPKHIYSIVKKMRRKRVSFEEIYDVTAVRVIIEADNEAIGKRDCYAALGLAHGLWAPITGEFDDYIARPKPNGYRSLHTAVMGPGGRPLEVQIRTRDMHLFGEYGVAAHWAYKEGKRDASKSQRFNLLRQLVDWQKELVDPRELAEALKTDLFEDEVHVFTPGGDVIALPEGATPLDFAYRIHTGVGHRTRGAKVNGVMVPLSHTLTTGDRVEILKKKHPEPSRDWLSPHLGYLHTASAKQKIRSWFREQDRDSAVASGREALERELARAGVGKPELPNLDELAVAHDFKAGDDLLAAIGFGDLNPQGLAAEILERQRPEPEPEPVPVVQETGETPRDAAGVSLGGVGNIMSQPARCCSPVPGDDVLGWVSRGRGIMIHRRDCPNIVHNPEPERIVEIDWGRKHRHRYPVKLSLEVVDRPGVLRDIADVISNMGINMRATHSSRSKKRPGTQTLTLELEVDQATQIVRALGRLEGLPVVITARRVSG
ncbi:GTP pyrophosphokinase [Enhygromyxa salina]|uniref:GTP pyrophosphokinase n=1 Tax=Enhygromyxa salina TaxID=215803 RepID=A0A0C2D1Q5_9BACT|nr:bifunctional (p)ppGpp synthetase/guanosine-3',5'-bis(diphosphate) 3'-pyrophosphohydrolase [Enhygromyxa salina]KIG14097.1 GTP pyrophosphokinase [Enhygromyxa salina]